MSSGQELPCQLLANESSCTQDENVRRRRGFRRARASRQSGWIAAGDSAGSPMPIRPMAVQTAVISRPSSGEILESTVFPRPE